MSKERNIETFTADWNGIGVQITWEPSWLSLETLGYDTAHLQVESILPERVPLPITETGYRSHFTNPETVAALGGRDPPPAELRRHGGAVMVLQRCCSGAGARRALEQSPGSGRMTS